MKNNELKQYVRMDIPLEFNEINVLKKHWSRVINIFEKNILPPYEILIHSSSICNLNCKWCIGSYVSRKENKDVLLENNLYDINNMRKVIDQILNLKKEAIDYETNTLKEYKVENVSFSGITGEPFMAKKSLCYAIDKLTENGIRVGVFTNGLLITEDILPTVAKLGYVLISIDAGTEETYKKLKSFGTDNLFDKLLKNIENLNKYKIEHNSNIDINVGYILNQYNYNETYILAKKLKEIGVHYLRFKTDIASLLNMSKEERLEAKEMIEKIKNELCDDSFKVVEIHNVFDDDAKKRTHKKCFVHYLVGNISSDGYLYPCNYHPKKDGFKYGSLLEDSYDNIWNNILENEIDKKITDICPSVCDPFKNRTNKLLEKAYEIYLDKGVDYLKKCVDDINL